MNRLYKSFGFFFAIITFSLYLFSLTSCAIPKTTPKGPPIYLNTSEELLNHSITLNKSDVVFIISSNNTADALTIGLTNITGTNATEIINKDINASTNESEQEAGQPALNISSPRVSEVEFYFLLKNISYFKHILKEEQTGTYNLSGNLITIQPLFIAKDSVIFKINNYTTKALKEEEWGSMPDFEIFVKAIYYRQWTS
jgi:hypothetical protein